MNFTFSELAKTRLLRFTLAPWILIGHGIPKLSYWFFGLQTWGAHQNFSPSNFFSGAAALIEFVFPLLILIGFKVRISAGIVGAMILLSGITRPLPIFMERVSVRVKECPMG